MHGYGEVSDDVAINNAPSVTEHFPVRPVLHGQLGAWPASLHELVEAGLIKVLLDLLRQQKGPQLPVISRLDHTYLHDVSAEPTQGNSHNTSADVQVLYSSR